MREFLSLGPTLVQAYQSSIAPLFRRFYRNLRWCHSNYLWQMCTC